MIKAELTSNIGPEIQRRTDACTGREWLKKLGKIAADPTQPAGSSVKFVVDYFLCPLPFAMDAAHDHDSLNVTICVA
jgi:hypothetical protein